jgi:formate hydrogenlyase subunit 6/NADH:ubiquinone oxidoreductase subunit I
MNILTMLWNNLRRGYQTLLFPARPNITARFRGLVEFDPRHCTGCAVCRMRCTSRAIEFKAGKGEFTWSYNPGQCTFCGRCVEGCIEHALKEGHTEHALSQQEDTPPIYTTQGELKKSYTVARRPPAAKAAAAPKPAATPAKSAGVDARTTAGQEAGATPVAVVTPAAGGAQ